MRLRRHVLFLGLLAAGVGLRVVVMLAYDPILLYTDSYRYLKMAIGFPTSAPDPAGYAVLLKLLRPLGGLATIAVVQHLMALGIAIGIYVLLVRRGVRPWLAALAAVPMLLDAYLLQISHLVMSDPLFIAFLFAGLAVLAWTPRPNLYQVAAGGALLAMAGGVRTIGLPVIGVALLYVLFAGVAGGRPRWAGAAALASAFAVVMGLFVGWSAYEFGHVGQGKEHGRFWYARAASIADCTTLELPAYQRPLCPDTPVDQREPPGFYAWGKLTPLYLYEPPPGMDKYEVITDFSTRVARHQPLDWGWAMAQDFWAGITAPKTVAGTPVPIKRWQFQTSYKELGFADPETGVPPARTAEMPKRLTVWFGPDPGHVATGPAGFLRSYQLGGGYLPPIGMGICLLLGLAGIVARSPLRATCFLFTVSAGGVVFASALIQFSWRYQLPGIALLPVAAALGVTALLQTGRLTIPARLRRRPADTDSPAEPAATTEGQPVRPGRDS